MADKNSKSLAEIAAPADADAGTYDHETGATIGADSVSFSRKVTGAPARFKTALSQTMADILQVYIGLPMRERRLLGEAKVKVMTDRLERIVDYLAQEAEKIPEQHRQMPSDKILAQVVEHGSVEDSPKLQELWAKLLSRASDDRCEEPHPRLAIVISQMSPSDAVKLSDFATYYMMVIDLAQKEYSAIKGVDTDKTEQALDKHAKLRAIQDMSTNLGHIPYNADNLHPHSIRLKHKGYLPRLFDDFGVTMPLPEKDTKKLMKNMKDLVKELAYERAGHRSSSRLSTYDFSSIGSSRTLTELGASLLEVVTGGVVLPFDFKSRLP